MLRYDNFIALTLCSGHFIIADSDSDSDSDAALQSSQQTGWLPPRPAGLHRPVFADRSSKTRLVPAPSQDKGVPHGYSLEELFT